MVVSNTSPIANLAVIGHLRLLRDLYGTVLIPAVRPLLDALVGQAGFWLSRNLYARVLAEADEL